LSAFTPDPVSQDAQQGRRFFTLGDSKCATRRCQSHQLPSLLNIVSRQDQELPRTLSNIESLSSHRVTEEGENLLGREKGVRIWIDDPAVSRHHARIGVRGGRATLEDLGSKNGTLVNGKKTRGATPLADGDRVQIGRAEMVLKELRPTGSTQTATHLTRPPVPPEKTPRGKTRGR